jgi:hypothetical protein
VPLALSQLARGSQRKLRRDIERTCHGPKHVPHATDTTTDIHRIDRNVPLRGSQWKVRRLRAMSTALSGVTSRSAFSSAWEEEKGAVRLGRDVQERLFQRLKSKTCC